MKTITLKMVAVEDAQGSAGWFYRGFFVDVLERLMGTLVAPRLRGLLEQLPKPTGTTEVIGAFNKAIAMAETIGRGKISVHDQTDEWNPVVLRTPHELLNDLNRARTGLKNDLEINGLTHDMSLQLFTAREALSASEFEEGSREAVDMIMGHMDDLYKFVRHFSTRVYIWHAIVLGRTDIIQKMVREKIFLRDNLQDSAGWGSGYEEIVGLLWMAREFPAIRPAAKFAFNEIVLTYGDQLPRPLRNALDTGILALTRLESTVS